jgi:hypothetical protein
MPLHHAYYEEASPARFAAYVESLRERLGVPAGDPSLYARAYEKFGIEEARELIRLATLKKTGERAVFFLGISSLTTESQQALLKLFEEPQEGISFILLVPHGSLIPTLRSRCLPYPAEWRADVEGKVRRSAQAKKFLGAPQRARSELIAYLLEEEVPRDRARELLDAIEEQLYRSGSTSREMRAALEDVARVRSYLGDRSPSLKMLLEHLALSLPTIS